MVESQYQARLSGDALENLEISLADAVNRSDRGVDRRTSKEEPDPGTAERTQTREVVSEILDFYRGGVGIARFAETVPLTKLLDASGEQTPAELKVQQDSFGYDFYLTQVTFRVLLGKDEYVQTAQFELKLTDDVADRARQIRAIRYFPARKDQTLFTADLGGEVSLDAGANFVASMPAAAPLAQTSVNASAGVKIKATAGPYAFAFRRTAISVVGADDDHLIWRYDLASELTGANEFKSLLLLKIANEARSAKILANLEVKPMKRQWLVFADRLPPLRAAETLHVDLIATGGAHEHLTGKPYT